MYVDVKNENYGFSTATHGYYVAVGNPEFVRYDPLTASLYQTGSVEVFRYNINTDSHEYLDTIHRVFDDQFPVLMAAELSWSFYFTSSSIPRTVSDFIYLFTGSVSGSIDGVAVNVSGSLSGSGIFTASYWSGSIDGVTYEYNNTGVSSSYINGIISGSLNTTGSIQIFSGSVTSSALFIDGTIVGSYVRNPLHTETMGFDVVNRDKDIELDFGLYVTRLEDGFGYALDSYNKQIAVGCPYYWDTVTFPSASHTLDSSGSFVEIWDYSYTERNVYTITDQPYGVGQGLLIGGNIVAGAGYTGSLDFRGFDTGSHNLFWVNIKVPPGYDEVWVYGDSTPSPPGHLVSRLPVNVNGGYTTFYYDISLPLFFFISAVGYINTTPIDFRIRNPNVEVSESFGHSVSLNEEWVAIGSPNVSASKGMVYLYKNMTTGSQLSWSFYQKLEPSAGSTGTLYGWSVSLNKSGSLLTQYGTPERLVVGSGDPANNIVYVYELSASTWVESTQLNQYTSALYPLTFDPLRLPILMSSSYQTSSFGSSVSLYNDTIIVGAPVDRRIFEYTGSLQYPQGAVYIFEKCKLSISPGGFYLDGKFYGDHTSIKRNFLGNSVSVYGQNAAAGCPKINLHTMDSCYIEGSLPQKNYCDEDLENVVDGQWFYFTKNTSSLHWQLTKVYQRKKRFMSPYRSYGASVAMGDFDVVVGAPMMLADLNRGINIDVTSSAGMDLDDVSGKAYIYLLHNFKPTFYVGNVFYRNGKIIVNTSGSAYEGLFFNPTSPYQYEYLLDYQSKQTRFEKQVVCSVAPGEFNVSTNPSAISRTMPILDLNQNGIFDFQDADVLLRYMKYRSTVTDFQNVSFDWSSSVLTSPDEISYYNWNMDQEEFSATATLMTSSLKRFELVDTWMQNLLDLNQDNRIDINDIKILWKYYSRRLTQANYATFINAHCQRKQVTDAITYLDDLSRRNEHPVISPDFLTYDTNAAIDKTGSFLAPMVTTVGLYDGLDLVAVAKLGVPIKMPKTLPINFVVKIDF